jgi:hypothetical protein
MSALDEAMNILRMDPLPQDARERLAALESEIEPFIYEQLLEGLVVSELEQGDYDFENEIEGGPDDNSDSLL